METKTTYQVDTEIRIQIETTDKEELGSIYGTSNEKDQ